MQAALDFCHAGEAMKQYVVYVTASGEVLRTGNCLDDDLALQAGTGETAVQDTANDATEYYPSGVKTTRPLITSVATWDTTSITANGTAKATLGSSLPNPSTVFITPPAGLGLPAVAPQTVTDGTFRLSTTVPGAYTVTVRAFPYQDYTVTINAS